MSAIPHRAGVPDPAARRRAAGRAVPRAAAPVVFFVLVLAVWLFVSYALLSPARRFLLPPPQDVVRVGFFTWANLDELLAGLWQTTQVALTGLVIAIAIATLVAVIMVQARWVEWSVYPWAVVLQTIPILAIVPLIGFWFQYGFSSRVLVCVLISLFPVITNTLFGLKSAEAGQHDLFTLYKARRWQRLAKLLLPGALPAMVSGWRIAAGLSVVGAIVGDFFFQQGQPGIGRLINDYSQQLQSEQLFAAIILSSLLGLLVFWAFGVAGRLLVGSWHQAHRSDE